MSRIPLSPLLGLIAGALSLVSFPPAAVHAATVIENFNTFPGSAADFGWSNGWTGAGGTSGLSSTSPLNSGGSYYSVVSGSASTNYSIRRSLDTSIFTDTTPYTISWDYRLDSAIGTFLNGSDNRIHFGSSNTAGASGSDANTGWLVGVKATGYPSSGSALNGRWFFYDNKNSTGNGPYDEAHMFDTGILLETGKIYSFLLEVDPATRTYSASITVDGDPLTTVTQTGLRFRNQTVSSFPNLYLGQFNTNNAGFASSIDNLVINSVPEPTRMLLLGMAALALLGHRQRAPSQKRQPA